MTTNEQHDALVENMHANNMTAWLETEAVKLGTDNQRERHAAGVLPDDELTFLARSELFKGFEVFKRWAGRDRSGLLFALKHRGPACVVSRDNIELETADVTELGADEWSVLKRIQDMVNAMKAHPWIFRSQSVVEVVSSTHWATCKLCKSEMCRSSVKVTVHWAGRELVREYALSEVES